MLLFHQVLMLYVE